MKKFIRKTFLYLAIFSSMCRFADADERPNIIVILTDDSGYSDLGCYGGEIDTPHLDQLAANGLRFKNFYNNGRCSPTRATLMTGLDSGKVGFGAGTLGGWQREIELSAYRARLPEEMPTMAELMKQSGYRTMMTGKWHLGGSLMKNHKNLQAQWKRTHPKWELTKEEIEKDFNALPAQRGFDDFFGLIEGETHFFFTPKDRHEYLEGNSEAQLEYKKNYQMHCYYENPNQYPFTEHHGKNALAFYCTDGMTDRSIEMIRDASGEHKPPFFLYMAYRAPHLPLQAPQELVDKYTARYENLHLVEKNRVLGLTKEKLWPENQPYKENFPKGKVIKNEADFKLRASIHAAMMESVDTNVGRVLGVLRELKQLDNTLIIYLSDNGTASHLGDLMNAPYRGSKAQLWEGGIKTHCIAHWPKGIKANSISESYAWVGDILPTCLELGGSSYPKEFKGKKLGALDGRSLVPVLKGQSISAPDYRFFNDKGQQSVIYQGRWKLLIEPGWFINTSKVPGCAYELYDLQADPGELKNIASKHPERVRELEKACAEWQNQQGLLEYGEILKLRPNHTQ